MSRRATRWPGRGPPPQPDPRANLLRRGRRSAEPTVVIEEGAARRSRTLVGSRLALDGPLVRVAAGVRSLRGLCLALERLLALLRQVLALAVELRLDREVDDGPAPRALEQ